MAGPRHVAIIMDGNGRWAKRRHLPRVAGHRQGMEAVRRTIRAAGEIGLEAVTLYAFSSENWRRPADEISDLMGLLRLYLQREIDELDRNGVRLRLIGDYRRFAPDLVQQLEAACVRTASNSGLTVALALNYGGQDEVVRAARRLAEAAKAGTLDPAAIDIDLFEECLDTAGLPPLDLMIRTSGESRLSNFLLWQAAYAELLFVDTLWPDFDRAALEDALAVFGKRERRFGGR
ncbi:isoprenyl transferase [Sphingomonas sp. AP4-R1]|uniref:isoprenyl transferase n=1 Tax=Sphingomonas sp. AP4-R1 TaxID=2735134 RepID=UPI0014939D66|nr:isoprenyl transferase [Sphingomonas sp. AP4-R1]QJU60809.1 isoprenyl transferase [Sphingomonas sp. AP4-R1]